MAWKARMNVRGGIAALLAALSPALYFTFSETANAAPYQTTAGHALLLITLPIGFALVWLAERRPPSQGQQATPLWARLFLGGAVGLLLATALVVMNARALRDVREFPGTSLGTSLESGAVAGHAVVRLDDGRTLHLLNAFCGVNDTRVTIYIGQGLLGLDRVLACILPNERPSASDLLKDGAP